MKNIFKRSKLNPILRPDKKIPWESIKVYNPGVICDRGIWYMFYRAVGQDWVSKIGYAKSIDGENFEKEKHPVLEPETKIEKNGVEDPRVTKVGSRYYMTYTAYDGESARMCLATSFDLKIWEKQGEVLTDWDAERAHSFLVSWDEAQDNEVAKKEWNKAGGIFPKKIKGNFWMIFGDRNLWLANSPDAKNWGYIEKPLLRPRKGFFDSVHVEMGPPPMETEKGWLVLYHGVDEKRIYRLGVILLDKNNPEKILYRSDEAVFEPTEAYEMSGLVDILPGGFKKMEKLSEAELKKYIDKARDDKTMPSVVFCSGAILREDEICIFYGAGDDVVCTARAKISDLF